MQPPSFQNLAPKHLSASRASSALTSARAAHKLCLLTLKISNSNINIQSHGIHLIKSWNIIIHLFCKTWQFELILRASWLFLPDLAGLRWLLDVL